MKPYQTVSIQDCGEALVAIPVDQFVLEFPPPYEKLGADYGGKSPYFVRKGVLEALIKAQSNLQQKSPGWCLKIFDAYRPIAVQQFMVDYTFASVLQEQGLSKDNLSPQQRQEIWDQVYQLWAVPSQDPMTPPPHSTGAAVDITLVDELGNTVDMGGEIDELSERSQPNYYLNCNDPQGQLYHQRRQLLYEVMKDAGFCRHLGEWWHFSLGDQMWAWLKNQEHPEQALIARYGGI